MTSTLSSPPTHVDPAIGGEPYPDVYPAKSWSRRVWLVALLVVVIVGMSGTGIWAVANWRSTAMEIAGVDKHTVSSQTFRVALKEKGELKAAKSTDIKTEVEGRSTIISLIEEGKAVEEGDLLVELASDQIEERIRQEELKESNAITAYEAAKAELEIQRDRNASDIRKAKLEIELKQLELEKYMEGEWKQKLKDADIAIEEANMMQDRRKEDFDAAEKLRAREFITLTEYQESEFNYKKAQWNVVKAELAKKVLERYTHVAEKRKRQSDHEEATKECERVKKNAAAEETKKLRATEGKEKELALTQDQLAKLRTQKEKCRITAPTPGFVVYYSEPWRWGSNDQIKEGAEVRERQILMQLPDTSKMMVTVRIHEAKTGKLAIGQLAVVDVEGIPGEQFMGKVTKIAAIADTQNRWLNPDLKEYETEITLDPTDKPLKPGVTAHVEILVNTVEDRLAVPVQSIYSKGGRRFVFRGDGRDVEHVEVAVGSVSTEWAEITGGLVNGDQILLAFGDQQTRIIPDLPPIPRPRGMPPGNHPASAQVKTIAAERGKADVRGADKKRSQENVSHGGKTPTARARRVHSTRRP